MINIFLLCGIILGGTNAPVSNIGGDLPPSSSYTLDSIQFYLAFFCVTKKHNNASEEW